MESSDPPRDSSNHWTDDLSIEDLENDHLIEKSEKLRLRRTQNQRWISRPWIWLTGVNMLVLCLTILIATFGQRTTSDKEAIRRTQGYRKSQNLITLFKLTYYRSHLQSLLSNLYSNYTKWLSFQLPSLPRPQ
jgi:hypothetical protein